MDSHAIYLIYETGIFIYFFCYQLLDMAQDLLQRKLINYSGIWYNLEGEIQYTSPLDDHHYNNLGIR